MDAQTLIRRHDVLKSLYQRVNDSESFFLSPCDLRGLGIQASQVGITDDGILQFQPCFFLPYPERVLQEYPIHPSEISLPKLDNRPNFDSILRRVLERDPNTEDPLILARISYEEAIAASGPDEWESHALWTQYYIYWHMIILRTGCSSLIELGSLRIGGLERKRNDTPTYENAFGLNWQIQNLLDDSNQGSPTPIPHAIIETVSHVPANYADQSLTRHDVRAIVNMMLIRISHRPFRYPSILSYMGERHGKIIQASFDGEIWFCNILNCGTSRTRI
ncbi:hypothetical protein N7501_004743 [Penicillium viridicatum]|nr:hypothetical protein N7501_004743 [Penicillium viridicatum]